MKSKKGVICVITNSRHCSFGYDQRVELFGKKGMLLSGNQKSTATEIFNSNQSHSQKPFLNFFIVSLTRCTQLSSAATSPLTHKVST